MACVCVCVGGVTTARRLLDEPAEVLPHFEEALKEVRRAGAAVARGADAGWLFASAGGAGAEFELLPGGPPPCRQR